MQNTKLIIQNLTQDYKNLDKRVIRYLESIVLEIKTTKNQFSEYTKSILVMLVPQLIIYFKALDSLESEDELTNENKYYGKSKSPVIIILQKANDQILNLLDKIAISPLSAAKIKKLNKSDDDESGKELLNSLICE